MNDAESFTKWFARFASGSPGATMAPREWQEALAWDEGPRSRVIRIPTGYGRVFTRPWRMQRGIRSNGNLPEDQRSFPSQVAHEAGHGV